MVLLLLEVEQLNLRGASLIARGCKHEALVAFRSSLGKLNERAIQIQTQRDMEDDSVLLAVVTMPSSPPIRQSTFILKHLRNCDDYVCHRALVMDMDQISGMKFEDSFPLMKAALLYNMALVCHQDGRQTAQAQSLHHATLLYEQSYLILKRSSALSSANRALCLMVVNNMALISHEECCDDKRAVYMKVMSALAPTTLYCSHCFGGEGGGALVPEDQEGIILNMMMLSGPQRTARAA